MTHLYTYQLVVEYNFFAEDIHEANRKMSHRTTELEGYFLNLNKSKFQLVRIEDEDSSEVYVVSRNAQS